MVARRCCVRQRVEGRAEGRNGEYREVVIERYSNGEEAVGPA